MFAGCHGLVCLNLPPVESLVGFVSLQIFHSSSPDVFKLHGEVYIQVVSA